MGRGEHPWENHHKELNPKNKNSKLEILDSDFNNVILGMLERISNLSAEALLRRQN